MTFYCVWTKHVVSRVVLLLTPPWNWPVVKAISGVTKQLNVCLQHFRVCFHPISCLGFCIASFPVSQKISLQLKRFRHNKLWKKTASDRLQVFFFFFFFSPEEQKLLIQTFFDDKIQRMLDGTWINARRLCRRFKWNNCSKIVTINRFAAIFNIPRNATINSEVEYNVYYSELPGC